MDCNCEFGEVVDEIVIHGLYKEGAPIRAPQSI